MMATFRDVIDLWPSPDALAADVGARVEAVRKWRQRDSIPADWWLTVVAAGGEHGHNLSVDELARIAEARREPLPAGAGE